jgi:hypothetical protein
MWVIPSKNTVTAAILIRDDRKGLCKVFILEFLVKSKDIGTYSTKRLLMLLLSKILLVGQDSSFGV